MAEPKDDPDKAHFVHKVANHLGSSRLEENLNDFFELHSEELRNDLLRRRRGSLGSAGAGAGDEESTEDDNTKNVNTNHGEFSLRIHELYREFLRVVQANLEEFLHAEGLTEAELRDACEKEMQAEDPGGLSFMHTLISSWEFSSFVELASDFVEEENDAKGDDDDDDDDEDDEEDKDDEDETEEGEDSDAQASPPLSCSDSRTPPCSRVRELGATVSGSTESGGNQRGRCERCSGRRGADATGVSKDGDRLDADAMEPPHGSRSSSRTSSRTSSSRRSSSNGSSSRVGVTAWLPTAVASADTVVRRGEGEGAHPAPLGTGGTVSIADGTAGSTVGRSVEGDRLSKSRTPPSRGVENKSKRSDSGIRGGTAIPSVVVGCCVENWAGLVAVEEPPESDRVGAKTRRPGCRSKGVRHQRQEEEKGHEVVEELSMRAEAKS